MCASMGGVAGAFEEKAATLLTAVQLSLWRNMGLFSGTA
jgi:hypothetical protein